MFTFNQLFKTSSVLVVLALLSGCGGSSVVQESDEDTPTTQTPNTQPIGQNLSVNTIEDGSASITLFASDADNDALTYTFSVPAHGTLTGVAPNLIYTPHAGYNGIDSFSYRASDGTLSSVASTVNITIASTNTAPLIESIPDSTKELGATITFQSRASDNDGDTLSYVWKEGDTLLATTASFEKSDFSVGTHTISCIVTDPEGATANEEMTITILDTNFENDAPITQNQAIMIDEDIAKTFSLDANDIENDTLTLEILQQPTHGSIQGSVHNLTYTPDTNYFGSDSLRYRVHDGSALSNESTITFTISPINDAPVVDAGDDVKARYLEPITLFAVANDIDSDYDTCVWKEGDTILATTHGFTKSDFSRGVHHLTAIVTDSDGASTTDTLTVTINQEPTADAGSDQTVNIGETLTLQGSGSDIDGQIVSYEWRSSGQVLSNSATLNHTPTAMGIEKFTLTVTDDQGATDSDIVFVNAKKDLPLLVVRIEFNDYQFHSDASTWSTKIFGTSEGQLNHYYNEISYGKFQFEKAKETQGTANDGLVTVSLNINHPGDTNFHTDRLVEAINLANPHVNFAQYDSNDDNAISKDELQIMFLIAGGEASTGVNPGVWAHEWALHTSSNSTPPIVDGVEVMGYSTGGNYSRFGESHFSHGQDATIGVIAHELGHAAFGLPDLYDYTYTSEGIGSWGLMGSGSWGRKSWDEEPGATPVHMTGWSKLYVKFTRSQVISHDTQNQEFKATSYMDYKLYQIATGRTGEYFLIENRANAGYDRGLFMLEGASYYYGENNFNGGLSILHIDDNVNDDGYINNDNVHHKLVDIEEASEAGLDDRTHQGHIDNLYHSHTVDHFTPSTSPSSHRYDGTNTGFSITNISNTGTTMTADIEVQ